ncbi:hypothetical protein CPB84DRAFT_1842722 [Gymnopilus junonius]|uniref:Uncharacterized protein n=1 Tax=Gymnopilus junonius TaxID=109634 RepID=A0A9P5P0C3_GYMJU|nr:hypothetical protein CPB84DRAFT_1842722 [Gymnopilus junonius]
MSTSSAISVSKSTLMHASLAHVSPEVRTMDDILLTLSPTSASRKYLPTEILLLIRDHLFMTMTAQLVQQSVVALEAYEHSLTDLLCSDCTAYNLEIYGPDIWQWIISLERARAFRSKLVEAQATRTNVPNPKQFVDREHWLECHLSYKVAASPVIVMGLGDTYSMSSAARPLASSIDIWGLMNSVLREFDCEAVREPEDVMCTLQCVGRGQICPKRNYMQVIPVQQHHKVTQEDLDGLAQVALHRASRDLCLSSEYPEIYNTRRHHISSSAGRLRWSVFQGRGLKVKICQALPLLYFAL